MKIAYWVVFLGIASCVNRSVVSVEETSEASLSEIAEHVVAIPLETNERCRMGHVDAVKRAGNEFFMLSNRKLYRFDREGRFLSRIASDEDGRDSAIRDFAVDPQRGQVVAIDTCGNALFFTYDGTLIRRKALADKPWQSLLKIAYHDGHFWATTEQCATSASGGERKIEKWLYRLDASFDVVDGTPLCDVDLKRFHLSSHFEPELCVSPHGLYAYTASYEPEKLLADTLALIEGNGLKKILHASTDHPVPMLPFRFGQRFLMASNGKNGEESYYFYCYDQLEQRAFRLKNGFTDDFYQTGHVPDLQALDVYCNEFCYCRSGQAVSRLCPERAVTDNPVLFLVRLKA